jgi:hypothetical protein
MEKINAIGQKFGKLLIKGSIIKNSGTRKLLYQVCLCDCGKERMVQLGNLINGSVYACASCTIIQDITGKRFGKILVIKSLGMDEKRNAKWECQCDCGNRFTIFGSALIKAGVKSCGCVPRGPSLPYGESYFNRVYSTYVRSAKNRNLSFELSKDMFREIISKNCYYCNKPPEYREYSNYNKNGGIICNGIDRVDNNQGYVENNVVSCCEQCNRTKLNYTLDEFFTKIKNIYENLKLNEYKTGG